MDSRQRAAPDVDDSPSRSVPGTPSPPVLSNHALGLLLRSAQSASDPAGAQERQAERLAGSDAPLTEAAGAARIHTGPVAATLAREHGARAVTVGRDVAFGAGQFAPGTADGRRLLRHELVHVLQQDAGGVRRLLAGERVERAEPSIAYRNGPLGPARLPESPEVAAFKRLVYSHTKQRLRMSSESLSLWNTYLHTSLTPTAAAAQTLATVGRDLFETARSTSSEPQYEQWTKTKNPAMREVLDNQIHGRWRACTGCHATIQADNWAKKQVPTGPEWEAPAERLDRLADLVGRPAGSGSGNAATGLSAQESAVWPGTAATLTAIDRIQPALRQLGAKGYGVLPEDAFDALSGLSSEELLAEVEKRIEARRADHAQLVAEIDAGEIDAFLFLPVVDALLPAVSDEVRTAVTAEIERRELREKAKGYAIGGSGLLALLLTVFPPTALLGVTMGVAVSAMSLGSSLDQAMTGATIREGRGAGVFSDEQEAAADEMLAGGVIGALMSAVDLIAGAAALHGAARPPAAPAETSALVPGTSTRRGQITVTMSEDGALFATHSGDPTAFVVVQNGVARGYRFRDGGFELVGTRRLGAEGPWSGSAAPDGPATPMLAAPSTPYASDADLVWVNTRSGVFHNADSPWYGTTVEGEYMIRADAVAAGHREARGGTAAAAEGTRVHEMVKHAQRPDEGKAHGGGWVLEAVERTAGGTKRVDELWINHEQKRILVVDTFTGLDEPLPHYLKGWAYAREPDIDALVVQGYHYEYQPAFHHPDRRH